MTKTKHIFIGTAFSLAALFSPFMISVAHAQYYNGYSNEAVVDAQQRQFCSNSPNFYECMRGFNRMERNAQRNQWEQERWERERYGNGYNNGYVVPQRQLSDNQQRALANCNILPPQNQPLCRATVLNSR